MTVSREFDACGENGKGKTKSAMLQMDNPESTDGERHRP
jgi:hypothetical protein